MVKNGVSLQVRTGRTPFPPYGLSPDFCQGKYNAPFPRILIPVFRQTTLGWSRTCSRTRCVPALREPGEKYWSEPAVSARQTGREGGQGGGGRQGVLEGGPGRTRGRGGMENWI